MKTRILIYLGLAAALAIIGVCMFAGDLAITAHSPNLVLAAAAAAAVDVEGLGKKFDQHHQAVKDLLDEASKKAQETSQRLTAIEQTVVQRGRAGGGGTRAETWGQQVLRSSDMKALSSNFKGRQRFNVKAVITSATTDADGSAGELVTPDRRQDVIEMGRRKLRVRQLFPQGETTSNMIQWPKQTGRTIGAATAAENTLKGQSELRFDMGNWPVTTIAHWLYASRQIMDDAPVLASIIDSELRYGLNYVEDSQLLAGGGTGSDLLGVYTGATAFSAPFVATGQATEIDVLLQAIAQVDQTDFEADGIVINPLDWRKMQSLKDTADRYLGSGPFGQLVQRLWQLPIVTSKAMAQRKFLVGAFQAGGHIFDREDANVEVSTEDGDNFRKNLVTVLGEKRLAFVVKHADVFVKGDFDEALAA